MYLNLLDGIWLEIRGLACAITAEFGYCIGMGAKMDSDMFLSNLLQFFLGFEDGYKYFFT